MALGRSANATQVTCAPHPPPDNSFFNPYWFTMNKFGKHGAEPALGGSWKFSVFSFQCSVFSQTGPFIFQRANWPDSRELGAWSVELGAGSVEPGSQESRDPARDAAKLLPSAAWHGVLCL